jgi:hypothetical protein
MFDLKFEIRLGKTNSLANLKFQIEHLKSFF